MPEFSPIVEDWWDLVQQVTLKAGCTDFQHVSLIAAILLMAREIKYNREDT